MTCDRVGSGLILPVWEEVLWTFLDVGRCLALFRSVGQRAFAHSLYAMERPREVRAVWRALLLPF